MNLVKLGNILFLGIILFSCSGRKNISKSSIFNLQGEAIFPHPQYREIALQVSSLDSLLFTGQHSKILFYSYEQASKKSVYNDNFYLIDKNYRIQFSVIADFEKAILEKERIEKILQEPVFLVFEVPFYKIQYGAFDTEREAKRRMLELEKNGVSGFVVRVN